MTKRFFLPLLLLLLAHSARAGKVKADDPAFATTLYMYALSASFNDTIVYITNVQEVDSAYLVSRKFLGGIREYVAQLDTYFREKGDDKRTNTVFFARTRKDAEKRYTKLRHRYDTPATDLRALPEGEFSFRAVRPDVTPEEPSAKAKKAKANREKAVKQHTAELEAAKQKAEQKEDAKLEAAEKKAAKLEAKRQKLAERLAKKREALRKKVSQDKNMLPPAESVQKP